ncbi:hypothetical protein ACQV2E_16005 [Pantoea allii]|uniref:hypothetical protein n=1 Tax=Pantoea allii TaxID=574096 RepID=UPI003D318112
MTDISSSNHEASKESDAKYTWYEKTVEYKFVLEAKELWGIDFLAPLDGSAERIGDALLEIGTRSYIIEFKKELKSMSSEFDKYKSKRRGYLVTCGRLAQENLHSFNAHYMVGGFLYDTSNLGLRIKKYFPADSSRYNLIDEGKITNGMSGFFSPDSGFDLKSLGKYIEIMTMHRKSKMEDESSEAEKGDGLINKKIIAVTKDKKAVSMSLSYFDRYRAELIQENKLQNKQVRKRRI